MIINLSITFTFILPVNVYLQKEYKLITKIEKIIFPPDPCHCKKIIPIYDTNTTNNTFIIDNLNKQKLLKLDKLLLYEKKHCGFLVSGYMLDDLSGNDNDIIDAYSRWRKCKNLMRSTGRIIYPDEREWFLVHKNE